jgi:hypothetical protein
MKYVLLFVETEEFANRLETASPDERARLFGLVDKWFADHAGQVRGGNKLQPAHTATTVRLDGSGGGAEPIVSDGPFVEGKEIVSGYTEIEVADLDEAMSVVRDWPGCPIVEIRPLEAPH